MDKRPRRFGGLKGVDPFVTIAVAMVVVHIALLIVIIIHEIK